MLEKKDIVSRGNSMTKGGDTMAVQDLQTIQEDRLYVPWKHEQELEGHRKARYLSHRQGEVAERPTQVKFFHLFW